AELRRLYPSNGRGRPVGRPNTTTIRAAICARKLRAQGLVGRRLGEAVAEFVGRDRPFTSEQLTAAERALVDAVGRGLSIEVPAPVDQVSASRARSAQRLLDRYLSIARAGITTDEKLFEAVTAYSEYLKVLERPLTAIAPYDHTASALRVRLDLRAERE